MLQRLKMLVSPFLGYRSDELPAPPHQACPTGERNQCIAEAYRVCGSPRAVGEEFGISGSRVSQIVSRYMREQARNLKLPLGVIHAYYRPRKKEAKGDTYTAAASPSQWDNLAKWKQAASDVADAQEEAVDWASVRWELDHRKKVNEAHRLRAKERGERNAITDAAVAEIMRIKAFYDSLEGTNKLIRKDGLAAQIDAQLAILREYGRTYP